MELACKAGSGKVIAAFPDVCMTPPENPATPPGVPVPYPNTAQASDTADGSKNVQISGKEIMLKNKSCFKTLSGNEAGSTAKKGVVSSKIKGKVYFVKWSMDVKVEGENVDRHLDLTTNNHGCTAANEAAPWMYTDAMTTLGNFSECADDADKIEKKCSEGGKKGGAEQCPGFLSKSVSEQRVQFSKGGETSRTAQAAAKATEDADSSDCVTAMRCFLRPYSKDLKNKSGCCPGQSPHHIPPQNMVNHLPGYSHGSALCVCLEGASQHVGSHGENHAALDYLAGKKGWGKCKLKEYNEICAIAVAAQCGCRKECIEQQLNESPAFKNNLDKPVTHWQSNSRQLGDSTKELLNKAFKAATKVVTNR
ncbi:MAG: DUF4150 domain-containing protein [Nitrosomonas sp.]